MILLCVIRGTNVIVSRRDARVDQPINVLDCTSALLREKSGTRGDGEIERGCVGHQVDLEAVEVGVRGRVGVRRRGREVTVAADVNGDALRRASMQRSEERG